MGRQEEVGTPGAGFGTRTEKKCFFGRSNFGELVLAEKLFSRAPLRDSEPSRAANAISDVFLVNRVIKHGTGEESRGVGGRGRERRGPEGQHGSACGVIESLD